MDVKKNKPTNNKSLLYKELVYQLQGIFFEIYKSVGPGFKELIYQNAIEEELKENNINYKGEPTIKVKYKNKLLGYYKPDFIVDEKVIIEVKSVPEMPMYFENQLFSYLKASNYLLGLLVNFGSVGKVDIRRRIYESVRG